jgi:hypothetical protein
LVLPKARNPARPARNRKIRLFDGAPAPAPETAHISAEEKDRAIIGQAGTGRESNSEPAPVTNYPAWVQALWTRIVHFIETH